MSARRKPELHLVEEPTGKRPLTPEEEAERQRRRDHWAKVHIAGDRSPPINLAARMRRVFTLGGSTRHERGGHKFEERS